MKVSTLRVRDGTREAAAGFVLLEGLIAILVFSFGILAIMGLQIVSINSVRDAKYRSDAGLLANQMLGAMWADRDNLSDYSLNATTTTTICAPVPSTPSTPSTPNSTKSAVTSWISDIERVLPGTTGYQQKIVIGAKNLVTVTLCWKSPQDTKPHNFSATAQIQG